MTIAIVGLVALREKIKEQAEGLCVELRKAQRVAAANIVAAHISQQMSGGESSAACAAEDLEQDWMRSALELATAKFDQLARSCPNCAGRGYLVGEQWNAYPIMSRRRGPVIARTATGVGFRRLDCVECREFRELSLICQGVYL